MKNKVNKVKLIILFFIIIFIVLFFFFTKAKNCNDDSCFDSYASKCSKAKVISPNDDNRYKYEILGRKANNCIVEVTLLNLSESQSNDMKLALEGRSMKCAIAQDLLTADKNIKDIKNLNDYCTGQLKEAVLQVTLDKMYEIIVKNIGPLATEFRKDLI